MKDHDANRHPGPWRVMRGDTEFTGILVAVGFIVMGLVSMPIATWFVLGTLVLGFVVALLLRFHQRRIVRIAMGTMLVLIVAGLWWVGWPPQRPPSVSPNALFLEPTQASFTLHRRGYWVDCWFDEHTKVDRCKLTDEKGTGIFEDVYLPCVGHAPLPQRELVLRGATWTQSDNRRINAPAVSVMFGQVLLPQSLFAKSRQDVGCSTG